MSLQSTIAPSPMSVSVAETRATVAAPIAAEASVQRGLVVEAQASHQVYMIRSAVPLDSIREYLCLYASFDEDIGTMRLEYSRDANGNYGETNRCLATMAPYVFEALKADGYAAKPTNRSTIDLSISPYEIRDTNHPPPDCAYALYIRLPVDTLSIGECKEQLRYKLQRLSSAGILESDDYTLHYPTTTREAKVSSYKGYAIVTFSGHLEALKMAKVKLLLDHTKWLDVNENPQVCRVSWCKKGALADLRSTFSAHRPASSQLKSKPQLRSLSEYNKVTLADVASKAANLAASEAKTAAAFADEALARASEAFVAAAATSRAAAAALSVKAAAATDASAAAIVTVNPSLAIKAKAEKASASDAKAATSKYTRRGPK